MDARGSLHAPGGQGVQGLQRSPDRHTNRRDECHFSRPLEIQDGESVTGTLLLEAGRHDFLMSHLHFPQMEAGSYFACITIENAYFSEQPVTAKLTLTKQNTGGGKSILHFSTSFTNGQGYDNSLKRIIKNYYDLPILDIPLSWNIDIHEERSEKKENRNEK